MAPANTASNRTEFHTAPIDRMCCLQIWVSSSLAGRVCQKLDGNRKRSAALSAAIREDLLTGARPVLDGGVGGHYPNPSCAIAMPNRNWSDHLWLSMLQTYEMNLIGRGNWTEGRGSYLLNS